MTGFEYLFDWQYSSNLEVLDQIIHHNIFNKSVLKWVKIWKFGSLKTYFDILERFFSHGCHKFLLGSFLHSLEDQLIAQIFTLFGVLEHLLEVYFFKDLKKVTLDALGLQIVEGFEEIYSPSELETQFGIETFQFHVHECNIVAEMIFE